MGFCSGCLVLPQDKSKTKSFAGLDNISASVTDARIWMISRLVAGLGTIITGDAYAPGSMGDGILATTYSANTTYENSQLGCHPR